MALLATEYMPLKPLIAIIGDEASKQTLTAYLKHQFVPQLNVISCVDASEFASCLAPPTDNNTTDVLGAQQQHHRTGIVRADWIEKHQSRRPGVAVVLVPRQHATGDPSSWANLASSLDAVRSIAKPLKIRVIVAVTQPHGETTPLPDDRLAMLARHSGAERGCVVTFETTSAPIGSSSAGSGSNEAAMRSLAVLLQAQAAIFYSTNAQMRLNSYSQHGLASVDANLRAAYKLGALAEMRGDWPGAVQLYKEAYGYVGQVSMAGGAPLQRFLEVRTVAETVHHRLLALLLGALRDPSAAATQFTSHLDMFRNVPLQPSTTPTSLLANHYGWLAQQYTTAAELVLSSGLPGSIFPPSMRPAQLYLEGYHAAATRRRLVQEIRDTHGGSFGSLSNKEESVSSGRYLGQIEIPKGCSNPSDEQVETWLEMEELEIQENLGGVEGTTSPISKLSCVNLLKAAKNAARTTSSNKNLLAMIDTLLGEELLYFTEKENSASITVAEAISVLCTAAEQYRRDHWSGPLYRVLLALRECASREGSTAEHATLSLEASAVSLQNTLQSSSSGTDTMDSNVSMAQDALEELTTIPESTEDNSNDFVVESETAPWSTILKIISLGFLTGAADDMSGDGISKRSSPRCVVNIVNATPIEIPFLSAKMVFEDCNGEFEVMAGPEKALGRKVLQTMVPVELGFTIPISSRKHSPWVQASKFVVNLSCAVSITYVLPHAVHAGKILSSPLTTPAVDQNMLRIELPPRHTAPEIALLLPEKAFIGEYLPAKIKLRASPPSSIKFTKCRVVVSATVSGKATAVLFETNSIQGMSLANADQLLLKESVDFEIEDDGVLSSNADTRDGGIEFNFGFAVQAPIEETILFTAQVHYTLDTDNIEQEGVVEVQEHSAAVQVLLPFECDVAILPISTGTTTNSTDSTVVQSGPLFTLDSSSGNILKKKESASDVVEDALTASLQSMSILDAQLRHTLIPRLPSHFILPGTHTTGLLQSRKDKNDKPSDCCACAVLHLRKIKPTGGEWRNDTALEALSITRLSIENDDKSTILNKSSLHIAPLIAEKERKEGCLAEIRTPGDTCCAAFQLTAEHKQGGSSILPSLGKLNISWRRSSSNIPLVAHSSSSSAASSSASTEDKAQECMYYGNIEGFLDGNILLPLPPVVFTHPLITAQPFYPSSGTIGEPISLEIEIGFPSEIGDMVEHAQSVYQEVVVVVGEPHGFLIVGPRTTTVPRCGGGGERDGLNISYSRVSFVLVPYHVGYLDLPEVKVCVDGGKELQATQGCVVYVKPAAVVAASARE